MTTILSDIEKGDVDEARKNKENDDFKLSSPVHKGPLMRVQYPKLHNMVHTTSLLTFSLLPKDQTFIFYVLLLQLALCRVAALKSLPVHHLYFRLYYFFRSCEISENIQSIEICTFTAIL